MAVHIPVVIDIDGAFEEAAKRIGATLMPVRDTIEKLTKDLSTWQKTLNKQKLGSDEFIVAAKNIQSISEQLAVADYEMKRYASNEKSIRQMTLDLAELERRWREMGSAQKYATSATGKTTLSADAQTLINDYRKVTEEIQKSGKTLAQIVAEEKRLNQLKQKGIQTRKYENAIMNTTVKTMRVLTEQERILSQRLNQATVGSSKFTALATQLQKVRQEIASARKEIEGAATSTSKWATASTKARTNVEATTGAMRKQSTVLMQLKSLAGMYVSVFGGLRLLKNIRETTAELELQQVALGSILRNTDKAGELFQQIKAAALKSPFEIKDLITYTKQLAAYRIETDKLFDVTQRLADVSAGLGVDMNRLILAYGQVRAASVLRGQELRQFTEAGIPLVDELAKKFTQLRGEMVSTGQVFELISKRAVPFSMIEEIFNDMTDAGGVFYNMQEKQSETLKGKWMKLKDAATIMYSEIGNVSAVHKGFEELIDDAMALARNWRATARWIGALTAAMITYRLVMKSSTLAANALTAAEARRLAVAKAHTIAMPKFIAAMLGEARAKRVSLAVTKQMEIAQYKLATATTILSRAMWKLYATLLKNPYAAAAAAVIALGAGIYTLVKNSQKAEVSVDSLEQSISNFHSQVKKTADMEKMIDIYNRLSSATERTADEQAELERVTKELSRAYPSAIAGVNAHTGALDINIDKVRELTKAEQDLAEARLRADEADAEESIEELKARRDKLIKKVEKGGYRADIWGGFHKFTDQELREMGNQILEIEKKLEPLEATLKRIQEMQFIGPQQAEGILNTKTLSTWKATLAEIQNEKVKAGATPVFSSSDIEQLESVSDLYDKIKKKIKEAEENLEGLKNLQLTLTDEDAKKSNEEDIKAAERYKDLIVAIKEAFGFIFKSSGGSKRDTRLQDLKNEISEVTNAYKKFLELKKYKSQADSLAEIGTLFPQLKGWEPTYENLMAKLESMRDDVRAKLAKSPKDKTLLDMQRTIDTEISNLKFDALKKKTEDELKKLSDEIKRSETVRNFYKNMLDLTGDEQIAATMSVSVYGGIGEDFKERMQRQLTEALSHLKAETPADVVKGITEAASKGNFGYILDHIDAFQDSWQDMIRTMASDSEKFYADWLTDLVKTYQKTKTYEERISDVRKREAQKRKEIAEDKNLTPDQKKMYTDASTTKEAKEVADIQVEALKNTYEWEKAFEDLDRVGNKTLLSLRDKLRALIEAQKDALDPAQYKALVKELEKVENTIAKRNPIAAITGGGKKQILISKALSAQRLIPKKGSEAYDKALEKIEEYNKTVGETDKIDLDHLEDEFFDANETIEKGIEGVKDYIDAWKGVVDAVTDAFDLDEVPIVGETLQGISDSLSFIAAIIPVITTLNAVLNGTLMMNPFIAIGAGIVATIGAIVGLIKGIVNAKIEKLNKKIEEQKKLLDDLEYSYKRLDDAIAKSFGSDYVYNYSKQLEILLAKQKAYETQAALERKKGKKADEDKIKEYLDAARDAADEIANMKGKLAEFFTGTDLASAASDFASAWIDAYKSFSSTTDAMREKFDEMVQNMVTSSLGAKLVQTILDPLFKQIDEMAASGGEFSASEIAQIAQEAPQYIDQINNAMTTMMNQLGAAGYNMRRQAGGFTGISRNIANASEESINGLAAGINTQNFYISYVPLIYADVALIREKLAGTTADVAGTGGGEEGPSYQDQMLMYVASLPVIRDDMAAIRAMLDRVIKPVGVKSSHYVSVNM